MDNPTHVVEIGGYAIYVTVPPEPADDYEDLSSEFTCPDNDRGPQPDGGGRPDIVGCGKTFEATPDDEGVVDCPHCGIFFKPDPRDTDATLLTAAATVREMFLRSDVKVKNLTTGFDETFTARDVSDWWA